MNANNLIRRLSLALLLALVTASQLAMADSDGGTLGVGQYSSLCTGPFTLYCIWTATSLESQLGLIHRLN